MQDHPYPRRLDNARVINDYETAPTPRRLDNAAIVNDYESTPTPNYH